MLPRGWRIRCPTKTPRATTNVLGTTLELARGRVGSLPRRSQFAAGSGVRCLSSCCRRSMSSNRGSVRASAYNGE